MNIYIYICRFAKNQNDFWPQRKAKRNFLRSMFYKAQFFQICDL